MDKYDFLGNPVKKKIFGVCFKILLDRMAKIRYR